MPAKALMVQGTASHVGKSVIATAFCRLFSRKGIRVAPFKGMNMSNNASVTPDGKEIATAQAVQAIACGIEPSVEMNPVLLKTASDHASQVVVLGQPIGVVEASRLVTLREKLTEAIGGSLRRLMSEFDLVVIEGAGSPAEVNLQETDLANMRVARMAEAPVILVADIERGGMFAQLIGTLELLDPEDRKRVQGFLINKFRGDPSLLEPGLPWLENRTARPVFGVIPFLSNLRIPEEDSLGLMLMGARSQTWHPKNRHLLVQVIRYPTISNFTDFDPLHQEPDLELQYLAEPPANGRQPDLLILPGSKSTVADLSWLRARGFDRYISQCIEKRVEILGICGGFQMLGTMITDPQHVESKESATPGLGLLPASTLFLPSKVTAQVKGVHLESGEPVRGYEIHMGRIQGARRGKPVFRLTERSGSSIDEWDGCQLQDRPIWGTYLHGLFDEPGFRRYFLNRFRRAVIASPEGAKQSQGEIATAPTGPRDDREVDPYDELADSVYAHLRLEKLKERIPWVPFS